MTPTRVWRGVFVTLLLGLSGRLPAADLDVTGPYLGQPSPGPQAQIFAPGIVCTPSQWEQYPKWSPDGLEFYYGLSNAAWGGGPGWFYMQGRQGPWTQAVHIDGGTTTPDGVSPLLTSFGLGMGPAFSPDWQRVYLSANAPGQEHNIWMSQRQGNDWTEPRNLHLPVAAHDEIWWLSATNDGTIYLTLGQEATNTYVVYRSRPNAEGAYPDLEVMSGRIQTQNPFFHQIAADESHILLSQWNASGGYGGYDLWISFRDDQDQWTRPRNLGPAVNTGIDEMAAFPTADGKYLFYNTRAGNVQNADIYWIEAAAVLPDPNGPIENLSTAHRFSSIQTALNYADPGDTIVLQPGVYHESVTIDTTVVLSSIDPNDCLYVGGTVIQGDGQSPIVTITESAPAATIDGLTIRAGSVGVDVFAKGAVLRNARILDNATDGILLPEGKSSLVQSCLSAFNANAGIHFVSGKGAAARKVTSPVIMNCIIVGNGTAPILGGHPEVVDSLMSD